MLNKQSQTADSGWSSFGVGRGANNPQREAQYLLRNTTHSLGTRSLTETGWGGGLDSTGSGYEPVASYCECGDKISGSCATELVILYIKHNYVAFVKIQWLI
jgi:hypothetical protein